MLQAGRSAENNKMREMVALLDSARVVLERDIQAEGRFTAGNYIALGLVYAYLDRKEEAITLFGELDEERKVLFDCLDALYHL